MYTHIWNNHETIQKFWGQTSSREVRQSTIELQADPRFDNITDSILDFTDCDAAKVSLDEIEEIAALDGAAASSNARIRVAIITADPAIIDAAQFYRDSRLSQYPIRVFGAIDEARQWFAATPIPIERTKRIFCVAVDVWKSLVSGVLRSFQHAIAPRIGES